MLGLKFRDFSRVVDYVGKGWEIGAFAGLLYGGRNALAEIGNFRFCKISANLSYAAHDSRLPELVDVDVPPSENGAEPPA